MSEVCKYCGEIVQEGYKFCPNCGNAFVPIEQMQRGQPVQMQRSQPTEQMQDTGEENPMSGVFQSTIQTQQMPMKWYKFLIYFALIAGALVDFRNAIFLFSGLQYGDTITKNQVYSVFSGIQTVDIIYGIALLGIAVYQIVVRQLLAHFKKIALQCFLWLYVFQIIATLFYVVTGTNIVNSASQMTGQKMDMDYSSFYGSILISVVMMIVNYVYFKKRKHLFVN